MTTPEEAPTAEHSSLRAAVTIDARLHDAVILDVDGVPPGEISTALLSRLSAFGIAGESRPRDATLLEVAHLLDTPPQRCVVLADSPDGVTAARSGGFALVIGLDRTGDPGALRRHGADATVTDTAEIRVRLGGAHISAKPDANTYLDHLQSIAATRVAPMFFDFDGTLSDIVTDPATATLVDTAAETLARLAAFGPVAVISGRDLSDVRERVGVPGIWYAGGHGVELVGPTGEHHVNDVARDATATIGTAADDLAERLGDIPGVLVEHKQFGVAVHYRNAAPDRVEEISAAVYAAGAAHGLRVTNGRKVIELRPDVDWDKGRALSWLLHRMDVPADAVPIYFGDDLTDEDAFDRVATDGFGIVVRAGENIHRRSAAQFAVDSPDALAQLLHRVADLLEQSREPTGTWTLTYDGYDPHAEKLREALCTVGNGYVASRGCAPECDAGQVHYPGTYAAGLFNRLVDSVDGTDIDNESLVNLPNWLPLTFRIDDGDWFDIDEVDLVSFRQSFDLRRAILNREIRFRDTHGRTSTLRQRRFVSMDQPHVCALETTIVAEDWSGTLEVSSVLDGDVRNSLVERYRDLASQHLTAPETTVLSPDSVLMRVHTTQSRIGVALAARTTIWADDAAADGRYSVVDEPGRIGHQVAVDMAAGEAITVEKVVALYTSRDPGTSEPGEAATRLLARLGRFRELLAEHARAIVALWDLFYISLGDHSEAQRVIRLHLLHLLQVVSGHTAELDVGVPARGLNGEAYRGHIFWDELFVLPVLNPRLPTLTKTLLRYRFRRLPEARQLARESGYRGAMFPWQSGSDGREESQKLHLNPRSGRWNPDPSARQHHIGLAVAYNVWQYVQVTDDLDFLIECGTELLVEIARFWASLATYDAARDRYAIRGVIGPDEFHAGYPEAPYDGIDNNAFTNVMAVWVIGRALDALAAIPQRDRVNLLDQIGLREPELEHWRELTCRMYVPFHDGGVISQFEGYEKLAELDWEAYRTTYGNIQRLDRILEAEGDDVSRYRVSKQADVLMLFYLLSADELRDVLGQLGYDLAPEAIPATIDYYIARTSHGSTLSSVVHAWVLARANRAHAVDFFDRVLLSDVADVQGGTTSEGIHLAAMAGSIDLLQRCFSGLELRSDRLILNPRWPEALGTLSFRIYYRGHRLELRISGSGVRVVSEPRRVDPITVECRAVVRRLEPGGIIEFH
ncbi:trehalose-phosphatase [Gordonia sp. NPDC003424]